MEKVQFQQEQMLSELKDLAQKGLFTQKEIKQIMKRRTAFETALVRRVAKKADYLRYAAYEMQLEALRKKRVERMNLPPSPPSISDYALVRRQFYIFERALKKFKSDVALWVQYIQVAKREGARALVGRITARALQLHPNTPALYILAASHELEHLSPSAARTLLQRGIRLNAESVELWREYVKMELGFVEGLRRRWDLLGITLDTKGKGKEKAPGGDEEENDERAEGDLEQGAYEMQIDDGAVDDGDAARQAILDGAIVKSVISSAAKALPRIELFTALQQLLSTYPMPAPLRAALLEHLHELLKTTLPTDAMAVKLYATRMFAGEVRGEELVSALRNANEQLQNAAKERGAANPELYDAYAEFVEEWCRRDIDEHLKTYLVSSLHALIRASHAPAPAALLAAHVAVSLAVSGPPNSPEKTLRAARKYTKVRPGDARVWRARLEAEKTLGTADAFETAWADARRACMDEGVWLFGLDGCVEQMDVVERLMKESLKDGALAGVHEALLMRYASLLASARAADTIERVRRIAREALPSARAWAAVFSALADADAGEDVLRVVYEAWRAKDLLEAALAWAGWLLGRGEGQAAKDAVVRARGMLGDAERVQLDGRWAGRVSGAVVRVSEGLRV